MDDDDDGIPLYHFVTCTNVKDGMSDSEDSIPQ